MTPKISIIIPVYNAEKYLNACLDSVLNQSFKDFEVLLINDGSKDNSRAICDEYAEKDSRFKVFHQANKGVSAARNLGLDHAKGEWVTFVDADDFIGENYFNFLNLSPEKFDFILVNIDRVKDKEVKSLLRFENKVYNKEAFLLEKPLYPNFPGPWGKFFKLEIIKNNAIRFNTNVHYGEDALFNLGYLKHCEKINTLNYSQYYYRNVSGGLSYKKANYLESQLVFNDAKNILKEITDVGLTYHINLKNLCGRVVEAIFTDDFVKNKKLHFTIFIKENKNTILALYSKSKGNGLVISFLLRWGLLNYLYFFYKSFVFRGKYF